MDIVNQLRSVINTPLAVTSAYSELLAGWIEKSLGSNELQAFTGVDHGEPLQFGVSEEVGIAVIPVHTSLSHRSNWFDLGYDQIKSNIKSAMANPDVNGILLDQDSPGGEVAGLNDFCNWLRAASDIKPIWSLVNEHSYSASYAISAACNRIIMPESAGAGSIGVVMAHVDVSKMMDEAGMKVTLISKGQYKTLGNAYEPLSGEALAMFEKSLEAPYNRFVNSVAAFRDVDPDVVKNTEAGVFDSKTALQLGLADEILSADDAIASFAESLKTGKTFGDIGLDKDDKKDNGSADEQAITDADAAGYERGLAEGKELGIAAVVELLGKPEVAGKESAAMKWLAKGKETDEVLEILEDIPASAAAPVKTVKDDEKDEDELANKVSKDSRAANSIKQDQQDEEEEIDPKDFGKRNTAAISSVSQMIKDKRSA